MINVNCVTKKYDHQSHIKGIFDITFSVEPGEVVCILGASGSGKTTLIRSLAGLEQIDQGTISIKEGKSVAYVSQEYTLWPHLSVLENLTLTPQLKMLVPSHKIEKRATELLDRFGLLEYRDSYPQSLSGGQKQRVALLRAVMSDPDILLLDEITSALDPELTKGVLDLIRALAKDGFTMVIVTHHMSFAISVADKIAFLSGGTLLQYCNNVSFFTHQNDPIIRSFIMDIARKDESIEIFKGREQFQAYHMGLIRKLAEGSTIYVAGAVGDAWYGPMGEFYDTYEKLRIQKRITWKMVTYEQGVIDERLVREFSAYNQFRKMPRTLQNPANYNIFEDTVITQIFEDEPTIIQIKNKNIASAYLRFFEELWDLSS